ncbi:hypothetical protein [Streptomyces sp. PA5.6]|uniref:hypothetical protein n=1 Tax=Streptomyces sp. PA5.6 TaxID=3035651 RepID=UPI003904D1D9
MAGLREQFGRNLAIVAAQDTLRRIVLREHDQSGDTALDDGVKSSRYWLRTPDRDGDPEAPFDTTSRAQIDLARGVNAIEAKRADG